jgi:hypothetical protein
MTLAKYNLAAIQNAGVPAVALNGGAWLPNPVDTGVGDMILQTTPDRGFAANASIMMATKRGVLGPSGLRTIAHNPTSPVNHQMTTLVEGGGGGASVFADYDFDLLVGTLGIWSAARVIAMGRISGGIAPAWEWSRGGIDEATPITRGGAGDYTFNLLPDQGIDGLTGGIILCQPTQSAGTAPPPFLQSVAINHVSDVAKQVTMLREGGGGAASVLTDMDVNVVVLGLGARPGLSVGKLHAACSIVGGVNPTYLWASGAIANQAAGPTRTSPGVYIIDYLADQGTAPGESIEFTLPRGVQAASGMQVINAGRAFGPVAVTQVVTQARQEGVAGAISVPTDLSYDFLSFRAA